MSHRRLSERELRALAFVDERELVRDLVALTEVPSVSGTDAECDVQHRLAKQLRTLDLEVDLWPVDLDATTSHPDFPGWEVPRTEAWGLVATAPGSEQGSGSQGGDPALVLQGHVDVVPPGDPGQWDGAPFTARVVGGRVHGRGTGDMKAGVVANLAAARAVLAAGLDLPRTFGLHLVVGEEDGGLGAFATLQARRNERVDPLMAEYPVAYPLSVGRVTCGDWASSVPDRLVAEGRLGISLDEDPAAARAELEAAVAEAAAADAWLRDHPPAVTWPGGQFASGRYDGAHGRALAHLVSTAHADVVQGPPPRERGAPYGSDLRLYSAAAIPTLHYGPGDVRLAHGPRESVDVAELVRVTETLVLSLVRACS